MAEFFIAFIKTFVKSDVMTVMLLAVSPFIEARGAIPFAFGIGMPPLSAFVTCAFAATLAIPVILLLFAPAAAFLKKFRLTGGLVLALEEMIEAKMKNLTEKAEKIENKIRKPEKNALKKIFSVILRLKKVFFDGENPRKSDGISENLPLDQERLEAQNKPAPSPKKIDAQYKMLFLLAAAPVPLTGIWSSSAVAALLKSDKLSAFTAIALGNLCSSAVLTLLLRFFAAQAALILNVFIALIAFTAIYTIIKIISTSKRLKKRSNSAAN
ncbi:MAG: small multi-drug export protein [Clostridiales bacterium]|jgi:uncharacterized membrane protein|nr:small multi-drug export protein [Clostridiales bacterium]